MILTLSSTAAAMVNMIILLVLVFVICIAVGGCGWLEMVVVW
jgi:hypothetical protein